MKLLTSLVAGLALAAFPAASAQAADDIAPCTAVAVTDAKGDQGMYPTVAGGNGTIRETGPENTDVKRLWFNTRDGVTTAHLEIANLSKEVPSEAAPYDATTWQVYFDVDGVTFYVKAVSDGTAVAFKWGGYQIEQPIPNVGTLYSQMGENGDTKGSFLEGPNGVISMEIPAETGIKPGMKLEAVSARIRFAEKDADSSYLNDRAPDAAADDKTVDVVECPVPDPVPAGVPAAPVVEAPATPAAPAAPAAPAQPATPAQPAAPAQPKKAKKKPSCNSKARKLKGKKRAKALKACKKRAAARR